MNYMRTESAQIELIPMSSIELRNETTVICQIRLFNITPLCWRFIYEVVELMVRRSELGPNQFNNVENNEETCQR